MSEVIVEEDAERAVMDELLAALPAVGESNPKASTKLLDAAEFFRVLVVGGTQRDLVTDSPTVVIEAYAKTEVRAQHLAALARGVLLAAGRNGSMGSVTCYDVQTFGRAQNLPNPAKPGWFRYQFTISADLRMAAV